MKLESFHKNGTEWIFRESIQSEAFRLQSIDVKLNLADVYEKVEFSSKKLREKYE